MNKKKILFITLPLVFMAIGLFFVIFLNVPRLTYKYSDLYEGYLVSKAYGNSKEYVIPKSYKGKDIVGVSTRAFYKHDKLKKITFKNEEGIVYIGRLSFAECKNLEEINISYANIIGKNAFQYDKKLKDITLSANYIGGSAFYKCESLTNVNLNIGVESIGSYAFAECKNLYELRIPETVKEVANDCFSYSGINTLYVPKSLIGSEYLSTLDYVIYY